MQRDTLFKMASNTKPVIASAILQLVDQGKLGLDDPVGKHIPSWSNEKVSAVTIRHLLSHTSGLRIPGVFVKPLLTKEQHPAAPSLEAEVDRFAEIGIQVEPGTSFSYNNPGFQILGRLVEVASQRPLKTYLQESIYAPLGMESSSRVLPKSLGGYTVGVLVQTNFGGSLTIAGVPVGEILGKSYLSELKTKEQEHGSCIVIVATNAPLDSRRLERLARRAPLGLAAVGSPITHGSGDYVVAFSTDPRLRSMYVKAAAEELVVLLRDDQLSPLFQAVRDATEEAVVNSLLQATTTTGVQGRKTEAIDPERVKELVAR